MNRLGLHPATFGVLRRGHSTSSCDATYPPTPNPLLHFTPRVCLHCCYSSTLEVYRASCLPCGSKNPHIESLIGRYEKYSPLQSDINFLSLGKCMSGTLSSLPGTYLTPTMEYPFMYNVVSVASIGFQSH